MSEHDSKRANLVHGRQPAVFYLNALPAIIAAAYTNGYAIAVHGSMARDFDLVAIPWREIATTPIELVTAVMTAVGGFVNAQEENPTVKPHGRLTWVIHMGCGMWLDLSVMPLAPSIESIT